MKKLLFVILLALPLFSHAEEENLIKEMPYVYDRGLENKKDEVVRQIDGWFGEKGKHNDKLLRDILEICVNSSMDTEGVNRCLDEAKKALEEYDRGDYESVTQRLQLSPLPEPINESGVIFNPQPREDTEKKENSPEIRRLKVDRPEEEITEETQETEREVYITEGKFKREGYNLVRLADNRQFKYNTEIEEDFRLGYVYTLEYEQEGNTTIYVHDILEEEIENRDDTLLKQRAIVNISLVFAISAIGVFLREIIVK